MKVGDFCNIYYWDHLSTCEKSELRPSLGAAPGWVYSIVRSKKHGYVVLSHSKYQSGEFEHPFTIILLSDIDHVVMLKESK